MEALFAHQEGAVDRAAIRRARVLIAGCGAVGINTAIALSQTGYEDFTLIDDDLLEPHNCSRAAALYHPDADAGRFKAHLLAEKLRWNPDLSARALVADVRDLGEFFYEDFDAVVVALDNMDAVCTVGSMLADTGVPVYRGSTHALVSSVEAVYNREGGPCLCCGRHGLRSGTRHSCAELYQTEASLGVPSTQLASAMASNRMAMEMLRGASASQVDTRILDTGLEMHRFPVLRDPTCPCHGGTAPRSLPLNGSIRSTTLKEALAQMEAAVPGGHELIAEDDYILSGLCVRCGNTYSVGRTRRRVNESEMHCPHCPAVPEPDASESAFIFSATQTPSLLSESLEALGFRFMGRLVSRCKDKFYSWALPQDRNTVSQKYFQAS